MKKILAAILILAMAAVCYAAPVRSIGNTADAAVTTGPGWFKGLIIHTDGTNAVTIVCYDNATAASGSKLFSTLTVTTSATDRVRTLSFGDREVTYVNGVYYDITTSGSVTYDAYFESN